MTCARARGIKGQKGFPLGFTLIEMLVVLAVISILAGILFYMFGPIMANRERKQARVELEALRYSLSEFHRIRGDYPFCIASPPCTPSETLFLSLIGFHYTKAEDERRRRRNSSSLGIQIPPRKSVVHESLLDLGLNEFDWSKVPNRAKASDAELVAYLREIIKQDMAFVDPWGTPYAFEYPRKDGLPGYRLFSKGPDGETGEGSEDDDVE